MPESAATLGLHDLILSHHTMRNATFVERVEAAAAGGYAGIGITGRDIERIVAEGTPLSELAAVLRDHDQRVLELEAIRGWSSDGAALAASRESEHFFYRVSDTLGPAHHLQAIGSYDGDLDHAAESFAAVCDRAAEHGLVVALEFLPQFTNIPDLATAGAIVEGAGRDNGGICLDIWHYTRTGGTPEQLQALGGERILAVQLSDGPLVPTDPDYLRDTMAHRVPPGEGEMDVVGFLRMVRDLGVDQPIALEVISTELDQLPPREVATRIAQATRTALAAAFASLSSAGRRRRLGRT
jgi:sugar phosphate isomerase/epimerase